MGWEFVAWGRGLVGELVGCALGLVQAGGLGERCWPVAQGKRRWQVAGVRGAGRFGSEKFLEKFFRR